MKKMFASMLVLALLMTGCNSDKKTETGDKEKMEDSTESKEEKNKQTAIASVNALVAGDIDATLKDAAADVVDYGDGSMAPTKGMDSIKASLHGWRDAMSAYKVENMWAMADGDYVAVFGEWHSTFKSDIMGMKTAGKSVVIKDVDIFKFNSEGKVNEHRNIQSFAEFMKQLETGAPK